MGVINALVSIGCHLTDDNKFTREQISEITVYAFQHDSEFDKEVEQFYDYFYSYDNDAYKDLITDIQNGVGDAFEIFIDDIYNYIKDQLYGNR